MSQPDPAPSPADMHRALSDAPDGPNVAPSPFELEAAQGNVGQGAAGQGNAAQDGRSLSGDPAVLGEPDSAAPDDRDARIRQAAYALAAERNFAPGQDIDDWLRAEQQVNAAGR